MTQYLESTGTGDLRVENPQRCCDEVRTLGLCNCDWRTCISRIFSPGKIWQIFESYSLIDFLLYNLRIPTNKRNILLRVL
jgi:hypothetical protein